MFAIQSHSEVGGHAHNEDAFAVETHPADADCLLCVVADGMGGQPGGGEASRRACRACVEAAFGLPSERLFVAGALASVCRAADEAVAREAGAGFTTLVALAVRGAKVLGASCGDSAALLVSGGRSATLTERQFKSPPVGSGAAPFMEFSALLSDPWALLVLTDGVWKYVGWAAVREEAGRAARGDAVIARLRDKAALRGSGGLQDDFTVVVVRG